MAFIGKTPEVGEIPVIDFNAIMSGSDNQKRNVKSQSIIMDEVSIF